MHGERAGLLRRQDVKSDILARCGDHLAVHRTAWHAEIYDSPFPDDIISGKYHWTVKWKAQVVPHLHVRFLARERGTARKGFSEVLSRSLDGSWTDKTN